MFEKWQNFLPIYWEIRNLHIRFRTPGHSISAVKNIHFSLKKGRTLGIVGESGSGKSVTALSIMRLISSPGEIVSGSISLVDGEQVVDLLSLDEQSIQQIRSNRISMIFQDSAAALNPVYSCGVQVMEVLKLHTNLSDSAAKERTLELFRQVELPRIEQIFLLIHTNCPVVNYNGS